MDDNLFKDVLHISQTQNETIQNLVQGTLYHVKVVVKADTENKDVVFNIATRKWLFLFYRNKSRQKKLFVGYKCFITVDNIYLHVS